MAVVVGVVPPLVSAVLGSMANHLMARLLPDSMKRPPDEEVERLETDLAIFRTYIMNFSMENHPTFTHTSLMNELRELCCDVEDYLGMVWHSGGGFWQINWILSKMKRKRPPLSAKDISELRSRLKDATDLLPASCKTTINNSKQPKEEAYGHVRTCLWSLDPRGLNEPMNELVTKLALDTDQQLKVVALCGSAGVGKATLARRLYNSYEGRFHCAAFLRVSRKPDTRRLLTSMLSQIKGRKCYYKGSDDEQDLIGSIKQHLQGKSYFIVLSDLWATSVWDILSRAFPKGNCCSRIITTTTAKDVALACCNNHSDNVLNMSSLNDGQSLELLNSGVSHVKSYSSKEYTEISAEITSKCGDSLPIATINVDGMLEGLPNSLMKQQWEYVQDSLFINPTSNGVDVVLNLIYNNLTPKLKTCLLYLTMYPEDYVIQKDDLVRQWVADGIFSQIHGQDELTLGYDDFDELLERGLIQPVDTDNKNKVLSCTVHHMVLDFIIQKSIQENFITVVDGRETVTGLPHKVYRLSVRSGCAKSAQIVRGFRISHVRSLMISGFFKCVPSLAEFCLLRVIILQIWSDEDMKILNLASIGKMFQLRYLKIKCNMIVKLPRRIEGRLQHLRTLDIDAKIVIVPTDIFCLRSLLHLRLPSKTYLPKMSILRSPELKTGSSIGFPRLQILFPVHLFWSLLCRLHYLDVSTCSIDIVRDLRKLTNLQDLHITCSAMPSRHLVKCVASILGKFCNLKSLILDSEVYSNSCSSCDDFSSVLSPPVQLETLVLSPRIFIMKKLPEWIGQLRELCTLKISIMGFSVRDVEILKELAALAHLSLYVRTTPEETIVFNKDGFQILEYFKFICNAPRVTFTQGAMPTVRRLKLGLNADILQKYKPEDVGIEQLTKLEVIIVKIGGADADQASREGAKRKLVDAFSKHPSAIVNVQLLDSSIYNETEQTSADVFTRGGPDEQYRIVENYSTEDTNRPAGSRIITSLESSSGMRKPGWVMRRRPKIGVRLPKTVRGLPYVIMNDIKQAALHLTSEVESLDQDIEQLKTITDSSPGSQRQELVLQVQDLVYDIQDFIDIYSWLRIIKSQRRALAHMRHVLQLKDRIRTIREWKQSGIASHGGSGCRPDSPRPSSSGPYVPEDVLVGIDQAKTDLLELVLGRETTGEVVSSAEAEDQKLRVVTILGHHGIGKTAIARAVYYDPRVCSAFNCVAWVVASECNHGGDLLNKIRQQVLKEQVKDTVPDFYRFKQILRNKRFLVVIDDLQGVGLWNDIQSVFPETHNGSRIIVTTSIQSVGAACSVKSRYIYRMRGLDDSESEEFIWMRVGRRVNRTPALEYALGDTLKRCRGLPLALISVANHLCCKGQNLPQCATEAYDVVNRVLTQCYDSLPDNGHRMCLLSLSTYPQGNIIKRKRLIRRWIAEGLAVGDGQHSAEQVADNRFAELVDRNIVEPVLTGNNFKVKACLLHGVMEDFIITKSVSKEFVTIIHNDQLQFPYKEVIRPVRRLFVHGGTKQSESVAKGIGLDRVRSLTICNTMPFDFQGCRLLRVLDLEGCHGVDKNVLRNIYKLLFLKYLSLRGSDASKITKKIEKLERLETLDIRETQVDTLPIEVFMLPRLSHLFGKFKISRQLKGRTKSKLHAFLSEKSRLQTLSGYGMVNNNDIDHIMLNIRSLKKVKVWCKHSIASSNTSLQKHISGSNALESLSIDFGNNGINFLNDNAPPCALISSMKLRGKLNSLPAFMSSHDTTLSELHLASTGLALESLSLLQNLHQLLYLKLADGGDGFYGDRFVVRSGGFPSLQRLCFEASKLPQVYIYEGGMKSLTSLHLLCPDCPGPDNYFLGISPKEKGEGTNLEEKHIGPDSNRKGKAIAVFDQKMKEDDVGITSKGFGFLKHLSEVLLHPSVGNEALNVWKKEARRHINWPKVMFYA